MNLLSEELYLNSNLSNLQNYIVKEIISLFNRVNCPLKYINQLQSFRDNNKGENSISSKYYIALEVIKLLFRLN